jgi:molybdopterin-biosynthesis enzyme MoeA-like protein
MRSGNRCTYVFTTGGIGPTHADITADCVAKAFGVPIDSDPRALAILHEWVKTTGTEMNEARLRLTRIPTARISFSTRCRGRLASESGM